MNSITAPIAIFVFGGIINLVWMLVNLKTQNLIAGKIDELKKELKTEYMLRELADERHEETCRRLEKLEAAKGPAAVVRIDAKSAEAESPDNQPA